MPPTHALGDAESSAITTQLLTLVNVSAAAPGKRKLTPMQDSSGSTREARRRRVINRSSSTTSLTTGSHNANNPSEKANRPGPAASTSAQATQETLFDTCFASGCPRAGFAEQVSLPNKESTLPWLSHSKAAGREVETLLVPDIEGLNGNEKCSSVVAHLSQGSRTTESSLSSYADLLDCTISHAERSVWRETIAKHVMEHAHSTRRRILKNNEKLAHAASNDTEVDTEAVRDQGFTRPKVLILAPFRNSALDWQRRLANYSKCSQIDQKARFEREYSLPEHAVDKLAQPEARQRYPAEHIETFAGNIDDNFNMGLKLTRKSFKLYSTYYDSDLILASPLGLRLSIDKEGSADFLSSIEILVIDQADIMLMQNWEHVKFVLSKMNRFPKESHDTDFSRVKQWYLDQKSRFLRQTIVASSYASPELLHLFSKSLINLSGKRLISMHNAPAMSLVRSGIRQAFTRFDCADPQREADLRFKTFTSKTLPALLRSAVSASKMLIFVPSYFDFLRVEQHLRGVKEVTFAAISEYSSNKQISRAREAFFSGRKSILLMTERFHFYKRYRIRGCQTIVFYGLPENAAFFAEILEFPFVHAAGEPADADELEPSEVKVEAIVSRYDLLKLQRIVGLDAQKMLSEDKTVWKFS
ncbi:DUF1253-domain-containing protein [Tilletiaria anomala UBC 951]|uniref:U3 small nucleolar RNA-associated protein 25 n=1 Tax=Tilletiaria anomala (strain ATCC 24038 / CBS 436.72 / UBC 951) TaxID=1037660 RepID=A0A066WL52_TILAU|nr:DUF1253-domain-containing protein [Tilletiaria anomala UBC 951]KDN53308.1 DUF1253-domain-containing protein [Tilletiaria anomala UBC 951]